MGVRYWTCIENGRPEHSVEQKFDPRHVPILLRTYKTGGAAAILTHTGDPNVALKDWFESEDIKKEIVVTEDQALSKEEMTYRFEKFKETVAKVKKTKVIRRSVSAISIHDTV